VTERATHKAHYLMCFSNGRPMGPRSTRILRDQLDMIELGPRVCIDLAYLEFCEEHVRFYSYACPECQRRRYA